MNQVPGLLVLGFTAVKCNKNIKIYFFAFVIGFLSLLLETVVIKILFLYLSENIYAVTIALSSFLFGMGISSLSINAIKRKNIDIFFWFNLLNGAYIYFFIRYHDLFYNKLNNLKFSGSDLFEPTLAALFWFLLVIPSFLVGALLPHLLQVFIEDKTQDQNQISKLYAFDIFGAVIGSLLAGFILIPKLGIDKTVLLMSLSFLLFSLLTHKGPKQKVVVFTMLSLFCGVETWRFIYLKKPELIPYQSRFGKILHQVLSPYGVVTVSTDKYDSEKRTLFINYRDMCHQGVDVSEEIFARVVGEEIPKKSRVMNIGLGCGFTANALAKAGFELDVIEINPEVLKAQRFFSDLNQDLIERPSVSFHNFDGYEYLENTEDKYQAILIDIEEVSIVHSSRLFTLEAFTLAKARLEEQGVFAVWTGLSDYIEFQKILYNTLTKSYRYVYPKDYKGVMVFYATDDPNKFSNLKNTRGERELKVLAHPNLEINTKDHMVLQNYFDLKEAFSLPDVSLDNEVPKGK